MSKLESIKDLSILSDEMIKSIGGMNPAIVQRIEWITRTNVALGSTGDMGTSASQSLNVDVFGNVSLDSK